MRTFINNLIVINIICYNLSDHVTFSNIFKCQNPNIFQEYDYKEDCDICNWTENHLVSNSLKDCFHRNKANKRKSTMNLDIIIPWAGSSD